MNRKKNSLFVVFIFFLIVALHPQAAEEKKEEEKKDTQAEVAFVYDKTALDEKSQQQLNVFMQIKPLIEKINRQQGADRGGKVFRRKISRLLRKAAGIAADQQQKEYLIALSGDIRTGNFEASSSKWLDRTDYKVDIIITPRPGKTSRGLDIYILSNQAEYTKTAEKYISILDKMLDNIAIRDDLAPLDITVISPFIVSEAVFSSCPERYILVFPELPVKEKANKFKVVILCNILESYFNAFIKPLATRVFTKKLAECVDFKSYLSNIILHRLSYYLGPIFVTQQGDGVVSIKDRLKKMFRYIEDTRAEAAAIGSTRVLIDEKLVSEDQGKNIYSTYVVSLVRRILVDPRGKSAIPALLQFNQLFKSGGITFDLNAKKIGIDKKQLEKGVRTLMLTAAQYERAGDYEDIEKLITGGASTPSDELKALLKKLMKRPATAAKPTPPQGDKEKKTCPEAGDSV